MKNNLDADSFYGNVVLIVLIFNECKISISFVSFYFYHLLLILISMYLVDFFPGSQKSFYICLQINLIN